MGIVSIQTHIITEMMQEIQMQFHGTVLFHRFEHEKVTKDHYFLCFDLQLKNAYDKRICTWSESKRKRAGTCVVRLQKKRSWKQICDWTVCGRPKTHCGFEYEFSIRTSSDDNVKRLAWKMEQSA